MSETTTAGPPTVPAPPEKAAAAALPEPPAEPEPAGPRTRGWLALLAGFVALALVAGATGVLFVRVQEARTRADDAVTLATGDQAELEARLESLAASLASLDASGTATADDAADARDQVAALRKCVNKALDAFAAATQSGKPASIEKC